MEKISQERTGYNIASLGRGALAGASLSAIYQLIHAIRAGVKEKAEARKELNPDEQTIVLQLPAKQSEVVGGPCTEVKKIEGSNSNELGTDKQQIRQHDGRYGFKTTSKTAKSIEITKEAGPKSTEFTTGLLLYGAGAVGGHMLVSKIYNKYRENYLKRELDKVQQEYLDQLIPKEEEPAPSMYYARKRANAQDIKLNGFIDELMGFDKLGGLIGEFKDTGTVKESALGMDTVVDIRESLGNLLHGMRSGNKPNTVDAILGVVMLGWLAGTGATAYLTKQVLDDRKKGLEGNVMGGPPKLQRIVVKTLPKPTDIENQPPLPDGVSEEPLTREETNQVKAAFYILCDIISDKNELEKSAELAPIIAKVAQELDKDTPDWDIIFNNLPAKQVEAIINHGETLILKNAQITMPDFSTLDTPEFKSNFRKKLINYAAKKYSIDPGAIRNSDGTFNSEGVANIWQGMPYDTIRNVAPLLGQKQPPKWFGKSRFLTNIVRNMATAKTKRMLGVPSSSASPRKYPEVVVPGTIPWGDGTARVADLVKTNPELMAHTTYGKAYTAQNPVEKTQSCNLPERVPVVKSAQIAMLKDLITPKPEIVPPTDYARNEYVTNKLLGDIEILAGDEESRKFLTADRQQLILQAIQSVIEQQLENRPQKGE